MKLKTVEVDGKTYAEVQDGKPVFVEDDGKELAFDAVGTRATISRLNGEAKTHRERAEAAEKGLRSFEGIEDPSAALKALDTMKNLDAKKLIDAGEVERVKQEIAKSYEAKLSDTTTKLQSLEHQLYAEKIGGSFARSKMVAEKLAIPADMVQARFGQQFKIEDGKVVAYDVSGNKIFSRTRPGELADFDEALDSLIDQYPYKDHILKGSGASGGGAQGGAKGGDGGKKTVTRQQFDGMDEAAKTQHMRSGGQVVDQ